MTADVHEDSLFIQQATIWVKSTDHLILPQGTAMSKEKTLDFMLEHFNILYILHDHSYKWHPLRGVSLTVMTIVQEHPDQNPAKYIIRKS